MTGRLAASRAALLSGTALALLLLGGPAVAFDGHDHMPPPVIHTPPPAPPSIYAPPKLPPDSQAIPSRKPKATTPRQPTTTAPRPTPAPKSAAQTARDKAAAEARAKDRETKESLQEWLTELGYNPGGIDGIVGPKTMDAVFRWVAEIPDPEKQQEARVAAHNGDYEALADMLYIQMVNPDAYAADGATSDAPSGGIAVQSPAPSPDTGAAPDATAGMTSDSEPAAPADDARPADAPPATAGGDPADTSGEQDSAPAEEATETAEQPTPPPPPFVWEGALAEAAEAAAKHLDSPHRIIYPDQNGEISNFSSSFRYNWPGFGTYTPNGWQDRTARFVAQADGAVAKLEAEIAKRQETLQQKRERIAHWEGVVREMKAIAQSRIPGSVATWTERVRDTREAIADWEKRLGKRAPDLFYESLASQERALANAAETTANSYRDFQQYRIARKQLGILAREVRMLKEQIALLGWHRDKATSAAQTLQLYAEARAAAAAGETFDDPAVETIVTAEAERQDAIEQAQQEMDNILRNRKQAEDELKSLDARTDLSAEEKARVAEGIKARMAFNDTQLREAQAKLAANGATFDGYDGPEGLEFDPYKLTETDLELTRIADEQKANERLYDELRQARKTIRDTAEGLDAIELQERVTELSDRVVENADEINQLAADLDQYAKNIRVTREQGELERLAALAEEAVVDAEANLAYTESVYKTARNAEVALLLVAAGGAATGLGGLTAAEAAAAQGIMAGFEGTTGAIEGYDQDGIVAGLKKGGLEAGKYYLPINTVMAVERGDDKTGVALGVLSDAAILFTGYKAARANLDKAQAAQAAVTRQALTPAEKAVSQAARQAADKGDDLIATYQKAKWNAQQARAAGVADEVAETTLQQAVKAIDRSDEAKLALKARDPKLQYQFVQDQAKIVKAPAQTAFEHNMRARGWSEEAIRTAQIRNRASAGTVGLDDDIRLLEPSVLDKLDDGTPRYSGPNDPRLATDKAAFRKSLTRNGETATLAQWEEDAAAAMDDAYQEAVGYSAHEARVNMTTSIHEEAYSDVGLLTGQPGSGGWAQQTASVTRVKIADGIEAAEAMGLGGGTNRLSGVALQRAATETKVAARELLKDLAGKAMRARPDAALTPKVQKQLRILDGLARGIHDPAVANRLLVEQTGANLPGTLETLSEQVEVLLKF